MTEFREFRRILTHLVGTSELAPPNQFSIEALDKAAKEFRKLRMLSDKWVSESDISKYFKGSRFGTGKFIKEEFKFSKYFKKGSSHFYNKADLIALAKELKSRDVNLARYMELREDQEKFKKQTASAALNKKSTKNKSGYHLPHDLYNINRSDAPKPSIEIIEKDLQQLHEQFFKDKLDSYIDIYHGNYAMLKFEYGTVKYFSDAIKRTSKKWCENFNYANDALRSLNQEKVIFIPIKDDDMYQL